MLFESPQLQPRDVELFADLLDCRFMALRHIAAIHFDGRVEAAKKRVQRLKKAKYLTVLPRTVSEPALYTLSSKSFDILRTEGKLDPWSMSGWRSASKRLKVSRLTLEHELMVMDCKAALVHALRGRPEYLLIEYSTWPVRYQFEVLNSIFRSKVLVKPDGFLRMAVAGIGEVSFFMELDRSTETLSTLIRKVVCYRNFYRQGGFARRFGHAPSEFRRHPFRVLIVCKSGERRDLLRQALLALRPPIRNFVRLSTVMDFLTDPLQAFGTSAPSNAATLSN